MVWHKYIDVAVVITITIILAVLFFDERYGRRTQDHSALRIKEESIDNINVTVITNTSKPSVPEKPTEHIWESKIRCGGPDHTLLTRPCPGNDTDCGKWVNRFFYPHKCVYQDITREQALRCLGSRTIAFIGDSQIRNLAVGMVYFLLGIYNLRNAPDDQIDYLHALSNNGSKIHTIPLWTKNVPDDHYGNGYVFPHPSLAAKKGIRWQIQIWTLYSNSYIDNQVDAILNNSMPSVAKDLRPVDFALWTHGIHDYGWFNKPPYGKKYYDQIVKRWLNVRRKYPVPSVWTSMNPQCEEKLTERLKRCDDQQTIVDNLNAYTNQRMIQEKLPYWDAGALLRSFNRCALSVDGVHVRMVVEIMRVKMLLNHLCNENMIWRADIDLFK